MRAVACPVVTQGAALLVFRHPLAGVQLVKGGIEPGETPADAATRELAEETGAAGQAGRGLGDSTDIHPGERWHFTAVTCPALPDHWVHHCADDGGHNFAFFWTPLHTPLPSPHDPRFDRARAFIAEAL